jgi:hypothetical protein
MAEQTVAVRAVNGDDLGSMTLTDFSGILQHKPDRTQLLG